MDDQRLDGFSALYCESRDRPGKPVGSGVNLYGNEAGAYTNRVMIILLIKVAN